MSADYIRDENGVVHVIDPQGDGEFTFCDRDWVSAVDGGFDGQVAKGPATCKDCKEAVDRIREGLCGVRWGTLD